MNRKRRKGITGILPCVILLAGVPQTAYCAVESQPVGKESMISDNVFRVVDPDYKKSPYSGMTRQHWLEAAKYILNGAFGYIHSLDDPMYFPKQLDKTYPRDENAAKVAKLEGLARTLFVAAPLLKEYPDLELNGINVGDYYRHQLVSISNPESKHYIAHRTGGPSQTLLELGSLAISMKAAPDALWKPLSQKEKDDLASTMLSYGNGPSIGSNWMFFNVFIMSFLKDEGYEVNEKQLKEFLEKLADRYRGEGWYNDAPAYDYYSMWAYQTYGPLWASMFGHQYPEIAAKFLANQGDMIENYPYMFGKDGRMNMWGRSIPYRFASVSPLSLFELGNHNNVNFGWMRRIASSTLLQFLENPDFLENGVPTMGYYGPFAPAVQIYSCRGSVFWCGKAFLGLLLPENSKYWSAVENNGPWENILEKGKVYNKFQPATNLMITDYPNSGAAEMRSWCHETVAGDWQKFRSSENYNKLAYNTEFPWMADGKDGEVSMNYAVLNGNNEWEVLRLYDFQNFEDGVYRRDAVLETDSLVRFQLADIPIPDGVLRVDRITTPGSREINFGNYSLPELDTEISTVMRPVGKEQICVVDNGEYELATIPLYGWHDNVSVAMPEGLHPQSRRCAVPMLHSSHDGSGIYATLLLWKNKKGGETSFSDKELTPIKSLKVSKDGKTVKVRLKDGSSKEISF